jgi:L-alanine-DL-glutamate epimerase-like enolase superfamily enzyme
VKISQIDTLRLGEFPNILFVEVHTDTGLTGLGETFLGAAAVEAYVHETAAPYLVGTDPGCIERHARRLSGSLGQASPGVERRGNSALDIALWDIAGQAAGMPLSQLLGGASRDRVRIYNTCAGPGYMRRDPEQSVANWGLPSGSSSIGYEDLDGFLHRADELADDLLEQGITAMKIWPFDSYAERNEGKHLSAGELDQALEPFRRIRSAVGDRMDVMVEFHGLWNVPTAIKIVRAVEQFAPFWYEDPIAMDDAEVLAQVVGATSVPIAASETLAGSRAFRRLLQRGLNQVVMLDLSWAGGVTEARKIAALAEAYQLPVTLHDCTGPVVLTASTHLSVHLPNALIQETVRAYYMGWYADLVTDLPTIHGGYTRPPEGPGIGTRLQPGLKDRADAIVRSTTPGND